MTTIDELIEKAAIALAVDDFAGAQFSQWTDGAKEPYLRRAKAVADALALSSLQEQKRKLEEALRDADLVISYASKLLWDGRRIATRERPAKIDKALRNFRALLSGGGEG